jgi:hypothetical protein
MDLQARNQRHCQYVSTRVCFFCCRPGRECRWFFRRTRGHNLTNAGSEVVRRWGINGRELQRSPKMFQQNLKFNRLGPTPPFEGLKFPFSSLVKEQQLCDKCTARTFEGRVWAENRDLWAWHLHLKIKDIQRFWPAKNPSGTPLWFPAKSSACSKERESGRRSSPRRSRC